MRIENHLLTTDSRLVDLTHRPAPGRIYPLAPTSIIVHYDVCHDVGMNDRAQLASGYHYHAAFDGFDHDGRPVEIRQYTPFNRRGSGAFGFNDSAINLVIVNPGPLVRGADGRLRTTYGKLWDEGDAVEMRHHFSRTDPTWNHWALYSYEERDALLDVCRLLIDAYPTIKTIMGHDVASPGRKSDPGPAFYDSIATHLIGAFPKIDVRFLPPRGYEAAT